MLAEVVSDGDSKTLVSKKEGGQVTYKVISKKELNSSNSTSLTLAKINQISKEIFEKEKTSKEIDSIQDNFFKLTESKDKKFHSLVNRIKRLALRILKIISFITIIGIPLALMIQKQEKKWALELQDINQSKDSSFYRTSPFYQGQKYLKEKLPKILKDDLKDHSIDNKFIMEELQKGISDEKVIQYTHPLKSEISLPIIRQFEKDIIDRYNDKITLKDPARNIHFTGKSYKEAKKNLAKGVKLSDEEKNRIASQFLDVLPKIINPDRDRFLFLLAQANMTQTVLNSTAFLLISTIMARGATEDSFYSYNGRQYYFLTKPDQNIIDIEFVRNKDGKITDMIVDVTMILNISQSYDPSVDQRLLGKVKSTLHYKISITDANSIKISQITKNHRL